jgi:uncharacterized membrane protein YbjE (DUF340 family)
MLTVIIIMSLGIAVGAMARKQPKFLALTDKVITYAIWLLLFLLGLSIGTNEVIVRSIGELGLQALVIAVLTVGFSVFLSYFLYAFLFKHES